MPLASSVGFSLRPAHTPRARAQNFIHNLSWFYGPIPAPAGFSPQSILTLVLADSHRGRGQYHLLSLPLAPPGSCGGHRYPQGQGGQKQQPGPRTPEHLETVRGETPSPRGNSHRVQFSSKPTGGVPSSAPRGLMP